MVNIAEIRSRALADAQSYIGTTQPLRELGWGVSGIVFETPDFRAAVKVHHRHESFKTEVEAYQFLEKIHLYSVHGIIIPKMRRFDQEKRLIEMDIVSPPFLLDFAGVKFTDPEFSDETQQDIYATVTERFGSNAHIAFSVYNTLKSYGMYYLDLRPSNLNLKHLPEADEYPHGNVED